ncbi:HAMP domain-containing histidine kinase [Streptomyces sp. ISL-22]|uniref:sensor histidine kinase n=1 Tax=unclassified Streptomyces TaxID=2593676 RepID=UPI001BE7041F|nr:MULTISPECIES: HAMP domain-containing sensor histidine kinase [unclassified Streptomyces]MBT2420793.1 HAMP domain-containing histidine kinase [Streptomyces sp. ISL-24]MBT2431883.1 HAMP domain-containing histidine kinase [Streptomyces sp. ISL-22]
MTGLLSRLSRPASPLLARLAPRTLRGRLSLVALTTAAFLMVILTVVFNTVVGRHLQQQADDELRTRAAAVATTIDTSSTGVRVRETSNDELLDTNVWIYAGTRLLERPPSAPPTSPVTRAATRLAARGGQHCTTLERPGDPVRLCVQAIGGAAAVVTALNLSPYRSSAETLLLASLALDAVVLACTYVLTRLAVGRALRPVRTMTDQAGQWSAVTSTARFGAAEQPTELARLGVSLDALLDRIRAVLRHEQQLTAELSHELRTPLSRIIAELDWWQARPRSDADTRTTHAAITDAAQTMRTICDTLLDDARGSASTAPGTADVLSVLRPLTERLGIPGHVRVVVDVTHPDLKAGVPSALLERIVSPLLDNALRYARSHVTVVASRQPDGVRVDVTDDGPGVPPSFAGQLFQPGRRADPADGHGGAGLGLPLARRLARSAGGEVTHASGHTPGAGFVISLPAG